MAGFLLLANMNRRNEFVLSAETNTKQLGTEQAPRSRHVLLICCLHGQQITSRSHVQGLLPQFQVLYNSHDIYLFPKCCPRTSSSLKRKCRSSNKYNSLPRVRASLNFLHQRKKTHNQNTKSLLFYDLLFLNIHIS